MEALEEPGWLAKEIQRTSEAVMHIPNAEKLVDYAERRGESQNKAESEWFIQWRP